MHRIHLTLFISALSLVVAIAWAAPHEVLDPDALSRLAMGRELVENKGLPASDPFTFTAPSIPFGDPEWLGDWAWYETFSSFSESGLQTLSVVLACVGYLLALAFGLACGGDPRSLVPLLLCTLPVAAPRINARNDLQLLWLFPLLSLLLLFAGKRTSWWLGIIVLLWVWANVHSSFVLAAVPLISVALDKRTPKNVWPWAALLLLPALPFAGLSGMSCYRQLSDHLIGAGLYRAWLSEWRTPLSSGGWLAIVPLHVVFALGAYGFYVVRSEPHRRLRLAMFAVGAALAYSSRRFLPLMAVVMLPAIAPEVHALTRRLRGSSPRLLAVVGGIVLIYLAIVVRSFTHREQTSVFARVDQPADALRFIAEHAPGSRVFNSYDDGPWLLWLERGQLRHYIDPRNNLGHAALERYVQVSQDPQLFAREAERLDIGLALIPHRDPFLKPLADHLSRSDHWHLVYWNGWQALFARDIERNRQMIDSGYHVLRPTLDLRYLDANAPLERDLSLLEKQSPLHANVIRAYQRLRDAPPGSSSARAAASIIESAWASLPDTDGLNETLQSLASRMQR